MNKTVYVFSLLTSSVYTLEQSVKNRAKYSVEEAVAELESGTNTMNEIEMAEIQMEPGRERRRTQIGKPPQILLVLPLCANSKQVWY